MTRLPFRDNFFSVIVDSFSSYCLSSHDFLVFLDEVYRVMTPRGKSFLYTPSQSSDAFRRPGPSGFIDNSTLDGIRRLDSPFYGNIYPFRFESPSGLVAKLNAAGFIIEAIETVRKSYNNMNEHFEWIACTASRIQEESAEHKSTKPKMDQTFPADYVD